MSGTTLIWVLFCGEWPSRLSCTGVSICSHVYHCLRTHLSAGHGTTAKAKQSAARARVASFRAVFAEAWCRIARALWIPCCPPSARLRVEFNVRGKVSHRSWPKLSLSAHSFSSSSSLLPSFSPGLNLEQRGEIHEWKDTKILFIHRNISWEVYRNLQTFHWLGKLGEKRSIDRNTSIKVLYCII